MMSRRKLFSRPRWASAVFAAVAACSATNLLATVISPSLPAGSVYRVVFITTNGYQSYNTSNPTLTQSVSYWDGIVNTEKSLSTDSTIASSTFHVVGSVFNQPTSTTIVGATVANMSLSDTIPVYNTNGQLVANNSNDFWSATHLAGMNYDRDGNALTGGAANAWDGWNVSLPTFRPYGHGNSTYYANTATSLNPWAGIATLGSANFLKSLAISEPITLSVPEPSTLTLVGIGLGGACTLLVRRRRVQ